jgi:hypothetical protein
MIDQKTRADIAIGLARQMVEACEQRATHYEDLATKLIAFLAERDFDEEALAGLRQSMEEAMTIYLGITNKARVVLADLDNEEVWQ